MTTKTTSHTLGPWEIGRGYSNTHATPIRWKGENLAWVCGLDSAHQFTEEQTEANANLIAAAPDLLQRLIETRNALLWLAQEVEARAGAPKAIIGGARHHASLAEEAIAKAEGKTL